MYEWSSHRREGNAEIKLKKIIAKHFPNIMKCTIVHIPKSLNKTQAKET